MLEHKSFTRQQFYELVWSKPMIKLAEELGVSDVALRKLCLKHNIARPPQGHWNRVLAGRPVTQLPLASSGDDNRPIVLINPPLANLSPDMQQTIRSAKQSAKTAKRSTDRAELHPAFIKLASAAHKAKAAKDGLIHLDADTPCKIVISPHSVQRALNVLSLLAHRWMAAGYLVSAAGWGANGQAEADNLHITIEEQYESVRRRYAGKPHQHSPGLG